MKKKEQPICEGINWIDITDPSPAEMQEISQQYNLNQHLVRDCLEPDHLPKYDFVDDVHFLILRFFSHAFDKHIATIQELTNKVAVFYTEGFLITIHRTEAPFIEIIRRKYVETNKCTSVMQVITRIIWNTLETFEDPANRLSEQVDFYENQIMSQKIRHQQMQALYHLKRNASVSYKILLLMQEPINHIEAIPGDEAALQDVKDQQLKIQTLYHQVLENVNNLMNLYISFSAQKTNDVIRVLTVFSVFFLPLTFIVGIYGMNFKYMPELNSKWGYPITLLIMLGVTLSIYLWFKSKKWL